MYPRITLVLILCVHSILFCYDLLCNIVQAFARADVAYKSRNFFFRPVEDSLDQRLQRGVLRLQPIRILFVHTLTSLICPWRIYTRAIDSQSVQS